MIADFLPPLLISFAITCIIIESTPGPNMGYLAIVSATVGRKAGLATAAGVALGLLIIGLAAALGLAAIISSSPLLYQLLRWTGVIYMLWLAWESWNKEEVEPALKNPDQPITDYKKYFLRGLITNLLNPKAGVFYVAVLPGFVDASIDITGQLILLSMIFVIIATAIHLTIVLLASTTRQFLESAERRQKVRRILSLALAAIAIWFAWSTKL